jgi:hypothetical protein
VLRGTGLTLVGMDVGLASASRALPKASAPSDCHAAVVMALFDS